MIQPGEDEMKRRGNGCRENRREGKRESEREREQEEIEARDGKEKKGRRDL